MRTTLSIDDDVLLAARGLAEREDRTIGEVISSLARKSLQATPTTPDIRNGIPLLPVKEGSPPVTTELINRLRDEMP